MDTNNDNISKPEKPVAEALPTAKGHVEASKLTIENEADLSEADIKEINSGA